MNNNLWILTEERPKKEVILAILKKFFNDYNLVVFIDNLRIIPVLDNNNFTFTYQLIGCTCNQINKIYIKSISGYSSFVDFLIFYQENEPNDKDKPIYIIEETKTDDKESRNTGVYQRCIKFIFAENYYPNVKKIMLYNLQIEQKEKPTETYIFGTRLLLTLNVEIIGKKLDPEIFKPFNSIAEILSFKASMRKAPTGNIPISINKILENKIEVSGRLFKAGRIGHDPNIGALSLICGVLRHLGWQDEIKITQHGLLQIHVKNNAKDKFLQVANKLNLLLDNIEIPKINMNEKYWHYETEGEKLGTIFVHLVVENFSCGQSIFENHAGCEKGYFIPREGQPISLAKYKDRELYKKGDKNQIIHIPDLILIDFDNNEVINIEGKIYSLRKKAIQELNNYDFIEENYIKKYYSDFKIIRTVVLYGSNEENIIEIEVGFLLNKNGKLILGVKAPDIFKLSIKNLLDFWSSTDIEL